MRFSGPLPGLDPNSKASGLRCGAPDVRGFLVAPRSQPQVTAPLGWALPDPTLLSADVVTATGP
ncbi:hypothetical protein ABZ618_00610 [Streptomyces roseolus]|uniref:hypothetical protein n=1 Tax=Streptomyces roseolus TaxID=67358 RepID=UPI00340530E7